MAITVTPITSSQIWETFVLKNAPGALFQSWAWGQVQVKMDQKLWRFGIYEGASLVGVFQILKVSARRGTFLHVRHGPVFAKQEKKYWEEFLTFMKECAAREHAWFIRVSPLIDDSQENRMFFKEFGMRSAAIHAMDAELCWVLDIDKSREELLAGMRKTTRYEIRQAEKLGVTVVQSSDVTSLGEFFKLYAATSRRQGFIPHSGINEEFEIFAKEGKSTLFLGTYKNEVLAGAIILYWGNQAFYHHGASLSTKVPASYLVQWVAIGEAQKRGIKVYNMWGIAPEDNLKHPWRGLTLFKKGFGGREIKYIHAHDLPISPKYLFARTVETVRRIRKGY